MTAGRRIALVLLALAACGPGAVAEEPSSTPEARARALLDAARAGDLPEVARLAAQRPPDRFAVLGALLGLEVPEEERTKTLSAYASAVETMQPSVARVARAWSLAGEPARALECRQLLLVARLAEHHQAQGTESFESAAAELSAALAEPGHRDSLATPCVRATLADALIRLGRAEESLAAADAALSTAQALGWDELEARVQFTRGAALRTLTRRPEALAAYLAMARVARRAGLTQSEGAALQFAIVMLDRSGEAGPTRDALVRLLELGNTPAARRPGLMVWLARSESDLGHLGLAAAGLERVIAEAERSGDAANALLARQHLVNVLGRQGRFAEALALVDVLLATRPAETDDPRAWLPWLGAVGVLMNVHLPERALHLSEELAARFAAAGEKHEVLRDQAIRIAADALLALGRRDEARARLESLAERSRARGRTLDYVGALQSLASLDLVEGRHEQARERVRASLEAGTGLPASRRADLHHMEARVWLATGAPEAALAAARRALALLGEVDSQPLRVADTVRLEAECLQASGRFDESFDLLARAAQLGLAVTRGLGARDAAGLRAAADGLAQTAQRALRRLTALDPKRAEARVAEAWWLREAGQAILLAEAVERSRGEAAPADLAPHREHAEALEELAGAQARALAIEGAPGAEAGTLTRARVEIERAHERVNLTAARLERIDASGGPLMPAAVEHVQVALDSTTAFVAFVVDSDGAGAFVVRHGDRRWIDLGPAADLGTDVQAWRELASTPDGPEERLAARLHARLLAPLEPAIEGINLLIVAPDGPLAYLPLEALRDAAGKRAVQRRAFAYTPSATTWLALARRAADRPVGRGFLGLADPDLGAAAAARRLAPLPGARAEVEGGAALFPEERTRRLLGAEASSSELLKALAGPGPEPWRLVSLACHGVVDRAHPRLSGLALAQGDVLSVEHLARVRLPADLVVLSACDTLGSAWQEGEGLVSLMRPLLQGGASRVIASAWRVPDLGTSRLLLGVERRFVVEGASAARALADEKRALLAAGGSGAHPYGWAPFVLWGLP